jgi:hypothetical protein
MAHRSNTTTPASAHLWEIGAPFSIPPRPGEKLHWSLSLIRKRLTTARWEHDPVPIDLGHC